jgi:predicted DNA-binding WGR domain protein
VAKNLRKDLEEYARVKQIMDRAQEVEDDEPLPAADRSRPFPPASEAEIRAFENKLGYKLPPSYREFLQIHNGWQQFWGGTWIAGVSGKALSCVRGRVRSATSALEHADWNPTTHLVLGASDNYGFLVFDANAAPNGERRVLDCPRGFAENTFESFADLVAVQLRCRVKEIAKLPKALRALPASTQGKGKRFECKAGTANKFWTVSVAGNAATYTWGKIGTEGQRKTKTFATPAAATAEVKSLIAEKTKKGYRAV